MSLRYGQDFGAALTYSLLTEVLNDSINRKKLLKNKSTQYVRAKVTDRYQRMIQTNCVNYLHVGGALQNWNFNDLSDFRGTHPKCKIIKTISTDACATKDLVQLVKSYGQSRSQMINVDSFRFEMNRSLAYRMCFTTLGCRGFSYVAERDVDFPDGFSDHITLRIALTADKRLFYPPRLKAYLCRARNNHYFSEGSPSIAFALGTKLGDAWYVSILQSDLVFNTPSYVRDHFRGWARVLFAEVIRLARNEATTLYLCRAVDVVRTCHDSFPRPHLTPKSWQVSYNSTAEFFGMRLVHLKEPVNIQLYRNQKPILVEWFYRLELGHSQSAEFGIPGPEGK